MPSSPKNRKKQYERKKKIKEQRQEQRKEREIKIRITQAQKEKEERQKKTILPLSYETKPRLIEMSDEQWEFCKKQRGGGSHFLRTIVDQYRTGEFPSSGGLYWYVNEEFLPKIFHALLAIKAGDFSGISQMRESYLELKDFLAKWHKTNSLWGLRHEF